MIKFNLRKNQFQRWFMLRTASWLGAEKEERYTTITTIHVFCRHRAEELVTILYTNIKHTKNTDFKCLIHGNEYKSEPIIRRKREIFFLQVVEMDFGRWASVLQQLGC